ncbi:serine/threonine-protein kinase STY8-like [Triticum dicoccoides]|uniref:serine/threonine-protein kinase STY8-like n=1 Tax=Triticum dicoccoides TaxID=85692 RepID=UPI00188F2F44|nr:serine/threonine-protein kinase STY8-like [Triticum dicoccoides]
MADSDGAGESCWPPPAAAGHGGGSGARAVQLSGVRREVYDRLRAAGNQEALSDPFLDLVLEDHYDRLPSSYYIDLDVNRAEDVLLHRRILAECADPDNRPVFHARFLRYLHEDKLQDAESAPSENGNCGGSLASDLSCRLNFHRRDTEIQLLHEIIFSSNDKPKLLCQLSSLVCNLGLNIREAHVFSTTDGLCLGIFVVDGWDTEETDGLLQQLKETAKRNPSLCNLTTSASERILELQEKIGDSEFDWDLLQIEERIASKSSGDLYRGTYLGVDVAMKYLRTGHANDDSKVEFLQQIMILRSVNHENVIRFYGACTKHRWYLIVTEYMAGGNLYDFLHKQKNTLELSLILRIAIGISKGMDYLHQNNIIHRDLKSANLLLGDAQVVKIADFGVSQEGDMTSENGTYRWIAPEVINHKSYDHKADVFSFAIVLWELVTSKVPYENLTPLQAALSVRQGIRLVIPSSVHPRLSKLIQRCWGENPHTRPVFYEITAELQDILQTFQPPPGPKEAIVVRNKRYR